jgi:hypothetical protein
MRVQLIICYKDGTWKTRIFRDPLVSFDGNGHLVSKHWEDFGVESRFQIGNDIAFAEFIRELRLKKHPDLKNSVYVGVANVYLGKGGWAFNNRDLPMK